MHQSIATSATQGPGNSGDIDFFSSAKPDTVGGGGGFSGKIPADNPHVQSATIPTIFVGKSKAPHNHCTTGTT